MLGKLEVSSGVSQDCTQAASKALCKADCLEPSAFFAANL